MKWLRMLLVGFPREIIPPEFRLNATPAEVALAIRRAANPPHLLPRRKPKGKVRTQ